MATRAEIKQRAKENLGGGIFKNAWMYGVLVVIIFGAITGLAGTILPGIGAIIVIGPLTIGVWGYFQKQAQKQEVSIGNVFDGFTKNFGDNFILGLMVNIFTALWSLLFVIPGIIKGYAYSMAFYIKNDQPELGWKECIQKSQKMMKGHKMELFIQDLSFIGWAIVGAFCLGIGTLWVTVYEFQARAEFYEELKKLPIAE